MLVLTIFNAPKIQMALALFLVFLSSFIKNQSLNILILLFISLSSTLISDFIFTKIRKIPSLFPSAAIVSGLIISLLVSPTLPFYIPVIIGVIAMFSKNFLRFSERHILNPAAFGLLIGSLVFGNIISWWAVSWQQFLIPFLILLSPGLISIVRMRRYKIILSFLITYYLLNGILNTVVDPTILFFSLVMLPEPMTTPNRPLQQILFGIFVALVSILVSFPLSILNFKFEILNSFDPLVLSLLIGNIIFFKIR